MSHKLRRLKFPLATFILVLAMVAVTGCSGVTNADLLNGGKITICHVTGSTTDPYEQITIGLNELGAHATDKDDIIPAPAGGCPNKLEKGKNPGKIEICHATGSATNPYNEITVDYNGLVGHLSHPGDIIPAPEEGCPSVTATPVLMTATPTFTVTLTLADTLTETIEPTSTLTATPTATITGNGNQMITICHATGSSKKPYVMITISVNGLNGHSKHAGDIIPAPPGGCPTK
jgi:hypothetical protein